MTPDISRSRLPRPSHIALIERVYAAALAGDDWPETIGALAQLLEADHAFLSHADAAWQGGLFVASAGLDAGNLARFSAHVPRRHALSFQEAADLYTPGKVISSADILSDNAVERSPFYNEVIRPAGGFYSLTSTGERDSSFNLSICRKRNAGPFDAAARRMVEALAPHIATALELHHRLSTAQSRAHGAHALLEHVSDAVILYDGSGVQFVNQNARRILGEADGLSLGSGTLAAGDAATTRRLQAALAAAAIADDGIVRRIALRRPSGRLPLIASILPLGRVGMPGAAGCVGLFVREPGAPPRIEPAILRELFGLTAREADIAVRLAAGAAPVEIAESLQLGIGTVRSHLKQVYAKTAVHSQAALVALLHGCVGGS